MKRITSLIVTALSLGCLIPTPLHAQGFTSGSNGSYGPMNITADTTLNMPADGIFHCTTITIAGSRTLKFNRNSLNTPVYLLATGDITISGTIDVSGGGAVPAGGGQGGPGGFDGGPPGFGSENPPGAGFGPGGGKGGDDTAAVATGVGAGAYRTLPDYVSNRANNGVRYGNSLLFPIVGGSGGGGTAGNPGRGGGGGGGAILIASSTRISLSGSIRAMGAPQGVGNYTIDNGGSGGAVRLIAPTVDGSGSFNVGGATMFINGLGWSNAGHGRTRIDAIYRGGINISGADAVGGMMQVSTPQRLSVVSAAGNAIPEGTTGAVNIVLPFGSSPNQTVTIRARDFGGSVPVRVVLTPDNGTPLTYDATINNTTTNPAEATVNVVMPINRLVRVSAWTR